MNGRFLSIIELQKSFHGVTALSSANLDVREGEILGLVGKNGAGKSTLVRVLAGVVEPDSGRVMLRGRRVKITDPHHAQDLGLSFVHQGSHPVDILSVAENIVLGRGYPRKARINVGIDWNRLNELAQHIIGMLDDRISVDKLAGDLTPAQAQLAMIAQALFRKSQLLVMDEPTTALTQDEVLRLFAILRDLRNSGLALIYTSHRLGEVLDIADSIVVMRDGRTLPKVSAADMTHARLVDDIVGPTGAVDFG